MLYNTCEVKFITKFFVSHLKHCFIVPTYDKYISQVFECIFLAIMLYIKYQKVSVMINDDHKTRRFKTYDFMLDSTHL